MKPTIHFWLAILFGVAIYIILIIVFDRGYLCTLPQTQIDQINNVSLSLSTSAICSIIFYYVLVYYPEKQRAKVIQSSINYNLEPIVSQMNWLFAIISSTYLQSEEKEEPNPLFLNLDLDKRRGFLSLDATPQNGLFECSQKPIKMIYRRVIPIDFQEHKNIVLKNLTRIISLPSTSLLNVDFIYNLNNLNILVMSDFLSPTPVETSDDPAARHYDLSDLGNYYKIYLTLIKYVEPTVTYKLIQLGVEPIDRDIV